MRSTGAGTLCCVNTDLDQVRHADSFRRRIRAANERAVRSPANREALLRMAAFHIAEHPLLQRLAERRAIDERSS